MSRASSRRIWAFGTCGGVLLAAGLAGAALAGCGANAFQERHAKDQAGVGSTHVSVVSVGPWSDYVDALQPTFGLDAKTALTLAVPQTLSLETRSLSGLLANLQGALAPTPSASAAAAAATAAAAAAAAAADGGAPAPPPLTLPTTNPAVPSPSSLGLTAPTATVLTAPSSGVDVMTQYHAAAALFQEAAMLDHYVQLAVQRDAYIPYVVRVQVALLPRARDMPYDAYTDLAFFPSYQTQAEAESRCQGKDAKALLERYDEQATRDATDRDTRRARDGAEPGTAVKGAGAADEDAGAPDDVRCQRAIARARKSIQIVPLLVTDAAETANVMRSAATVSQLAVAVQAMLQTYGVGADATAFNESLQSVIGHDLNSVLTVARLTDNEVRVRFGAHYRGTSHYGMEPQNQSVTLLVLVPQMLVLEETSRVRRTIDVAARTTFVDAETGEALREQGSGQLDDELARVAQRYGRPSRGDDLEPWRELYASIQANDYDRFLDRFHTLKLGDDRAGAVWTDLAPVALGEPHASASFQLPRPSATRPCVYQQVALLKEDDTGGTATVTIAGRHLYAHAAHAALRLKTPEGEREVRPSAIAAPTLPDRGGDDALTLTFPSLSTWRLPTTSMTLGVTIDDPVAGSFRDGERDGACKRVTTLDVAYHPQPRPYTVQLANVVSFDEGTVALTFTLAGAPTPAPVTFMVKGGQVASVHSADPEMVTSTDDLVHVHKSGTVTLKLKKAKAGQKVRIVSWGSDDDVPSILELSVVEPPSPRAEAPKVEKDAGAAKKPPKK